jgi:hypothetical protein
MLKRNIIIQIVIAVVTLFSIGTNDLWAQTEIDINRMIMMSTKIHINGEPAYPTPWVFDFYVNLVEPGDLEYINVTRPGELEPFAIMWAEENNPGWWEYLLPASYETLSDLRVDYPEGIYKFDFWSSGSVLLRTVYLDYSDMPGEPLNPVEFTYPVYPDQTGINPNPTFTWSVNSNNGDILSMALCDWNSDMDIYSEHLSMNATSWEPGPLSANTEYGLWVSVLNIKDLGKGKFTYPTMTVDGDEFEYTLEIEYYNEIDFTTATINVVPDTITTKTKSITCHIWPLYGYDVTQIDPDSIYLNGQIRPTSTSVRTKQQMMIVKFPTANLGLLPNTELILGIEGMVGETSFFDIDFVMVIQNGGGPN